ncbi:MAG TPA: transcriptional repressor [Terriglobales bacterium]|nr:transcriptional repressor [Terriglobales bacterium]
MEEKFKRFSRQREEILKILKETKSHPTAEWVYFQAKRKLPRLSLGTVYRNLNDLYQNGAIRKLRMGTPFDHFDADTSPHQHFICKKCGRIYDLFIDVEEDLKAMAEREKKFRIEKVEVEFHGVCLNCKKLNQ